MTAQKMFWKCETCKRVFYTYKKDYHGTGEMECYYCGSPMFVFIGNNFEPIKKKW